MKKVAIVGAHGYTGRELARLLIRHPYAVLTGVFTTQADWHLGDDLPEVMDNSIPHYDVAQLSQQCAAFDVVFLATPPDVSAQLAPIVMAGGAAVIDLSGAFRLTPAQCKTVYGITHEVPTLLDEAVYGLAPWWKKQNVADQNVLIANPGCYATCALMSLLPLLTSSVIKTDSIIIDAKSGASGAGRKAQKHLLFCELADTFYPYKVHGHQHIPEIAHCIDQMTEISCCPTMITHLLPLKRGIAMTIYCEAMAPHTTSMIEDALAEAYRAAYADYPLVKHQRLTNDNQTQNMRLLSLQQVVGSARIHIGYAVVQGKVIIFSCIDNLLKGAASQAVENFNMLYDFPIATALNQLEGTL